MSDIHVLNEIALGLILFAIGGEIEIAHLRSMGKKVIFIGYADATAYIPDDRYIREDGYEVSRAHDMRDADAPHVKSSDLRPFYCEP